MFSKPLAFVSDALLNTVRKTSRLSRSQTFQFGYGTLEPRKLLAAIAWTGADISENRDVSVNGSLVFALNGSTSTGVTTTVNGVDFVSSTEDLAGVQAQAQSPGNESITTTLVNDNLGSFATGGLDTDGLGALIQGGWWGTGSTGTAEVELTGLTVGETYEVQLFSNDARNNRNNNFISRLDNGDGGAGIDLELNNQPLGGLAGDYGIGTFIADSSTQSFNITGILNGNVNGGRAQVNAIQLRKIETPDLLPGAVPFVNEFAASNAGVLDDDNGNSSDWIEIYNAGEDSIDLGGYSLTDDPTDTTKYVIPDNTTLAGGQYLIVFAGDDADPTNGSDLYTGFGLASGGEYVGFYDSEGNLVNEFGPNGNDYPAQFTDVSYGIENDSTFNQVSFFATPTPGSANINPVDGVIDALPTVNVARGFYETAFPVAVTSQTPGATIIYTTDGSEPSLTNGTQVLPDNSNSLVVANILISETTSLRTSAFITGFLTEGFTTHTYVFLNDVISSSVLDPEITNEYTDDELRAGLLDIPTLSFNYDTEITDSFVPEQAASIEWLAPNGSEGFQIDAGISGFGGFFTNFAKKNFRVEFRSEYGASQLEFPLFEGFDNGIPATDSFDSLDFRSGSHDKVQRGFGLSNRFVDDTLMDAGHVVPHGRFVHIYNNGVYWGQYHMRERWDADFLSQYYGGEEDDYEAVNGNINNGNSTPNGWALGEVYDGSGEAWANITELADQDGSGNPTGGYQELKEVVNLPQYLDYTLVWMAGRAENEYRSGGSIDGAVPYTFTLNDADGWFRGTNDNTGNAGPANIFGTLVDEGDPEFLTLLSDRIHNMFGEDGVLSTERSVERLQERLDEIELSFVLESARWSGVFTEATGSFEARTPESFANAANSALTNMLPNLAPSMLANFRARGLYADFDAPSFEINGSTLNGGEIAAGDTLTISADETIYYTTDGTDPRLVGGGINPNAIIFDATSSTSTVFGFGEIWNYLDDGSDQGTAWQTPSFNDSSWASGQGELGFGDDPLTEIELGRDPNNVNATTYFRRTFEVSESFDFAELNLFYDDGAIVYLNGDEIGRTSNLSNLGFDVEFDTFASGSVRDGVNQIFDISNFLVVGTNTLAIEIHQASAGSSDLSFDAAVSTTALLGDAGSIELNTSTNVLARAFRNGEWSGVNNAIFAIPVSQSDLRISELHFNPADPSAAEIAAGFGDNDDFEFIELFNPSTTGTINLSGVQLSDGVTFSFGNVDLLPGERVVVVEDVDAFMERYGDSANVLGQWSGGLSNNGEEVTLIDSSSDEIMSVNYQNNDPWYNAADGHGFSLVLEDPVNTPVNELGKYFSWRSSTIQGGRPGEASLDRTGVVVNEVLAHTDAPQSDSIELFNPTSASINISGWYLSDEGDDLFKYQISAGTVIAAGGYLVFDESDFNATSSGFALNGSEGDQVYLSQAVAGFTLLQDAVEFDATFNGESLGRLPNGTGRLTRLAETSFGSANGEAEVGPLVISEVNYHPEDPSSVALAIDPTLTDNDLEYIEIANPTAATIDLTNWRIRGEADFDFAPGTSLSAGEAIVVVSFDPVVDTVKLNAFRAQYGIGSGVTIVGGLSASLSNSTGRIALQQPDTPDAVGEIPNVVVDEVVYDDLLPWPDADGSGQSLVRDDLDANGNFAASWIAAVPTPGAFETTFLLGDTNLDGVVNFGDISQFISLLQVGTFLDEADINRDGLVNFLDISPFITILRS